VAALARQHNDANIISLPARFIESGEAEHILTAFFEADFEGGRHKERVDKIDRQA
jgi:ribose 5-phosphate isomerase B